MSCKKMYGSGSDQTQDPSEDVAFLLVEQNTDCVFKDPDRLYDGDAMESNGIKKEPQLNGGRKY